MKFSDSCKRKHGWASLIILKSTRLWILKKSGHLPNKNTTKGVDSQANQTNVYLKQIEVFKTIKGKNYILFVFVFRSRDHTNYGVIILTMAWSSRNEKFHRAIRIIKEKKESISQQLAGCFPSGFFWKQRIYLKKLANFIMSVCDTGDSFLS